MNHHIDVNIDYFDRYLNRIRRNVSMVCIFLIILATIPVAVSRALQGWDVATSIQLLSAIILIALFVYVALKRYTKWVGVAIYWIDMLLMAVVTLDPQGSQLILLFFITPLLVAYLFFSKSTAFVASVFSYLFLSVLYYMQYMDPDDSSYLLDLVMLVFGGISSVLGLHVVIGFRHSIEEKLINVAQTDALTGLPNRMYFDERLDQEISRAEREESPLCLGLIDLDHFKKINDTHGHECGDEVLKHIAQNISRAIRATDTPCRVGGEEFVIIMPNTDFQSAHSSLERLRKLIEQTPFHWKGKPLSLTASMGLSELKLKHNKNSIFADADDAMYLAKKRGRNQVAYVQKDE